MAASQSLRAVLDTNVVLAWLVFRDARVAALANALETHQVRWVACPRMREELARTLAYTNLAAWNPDSERTLAVFDAHAEHHPDPPTRLAGPLLCSDPDDQVFVELSLATNAGWLFTRDRALLKLKRRAAVHKLQIALPESWAPNHT